MPPLFGPSGNSNIFYEQGYKSSLEAPKWLAQMGLTAYEYPCGKGINIGEKTARRLGEEAKKHQLSMSLHAPYYLNLATPIRKNRKKPLIILSEVWKRQVFSAPLGW